MHVEAEGASLQSHDRDDKSLTGSGGLRHTKNAEDATSLTSFNPFSEEDEHDQSGYALVTSLFSKVKTSLTNQLSSNKEPLTNTPTSPIPSVEKKFTLSPRPTAPSSRPSLASTSRPSSMTAPKAAPPLVSLTPVISELPRYDTIHDDDPMRPPSRGGLFYSPTADSISSPDAGFIYGTSIPGFPIQDDARSIRTSGSFTRSQPVSKVIRKIRGEGLSRDYWMDDQNCKECYDCKSPFSTWRRKHHCRICGQIFCSRCASNIIKGTRFGADSTIRVCNLCLEKLEREEDDPDEDDRRSLFSTVTSPFTAHQYPFSNTRDLHAIAETNSRQRLQSFGSDDGSFGSRPRTPGNDLDLWDEMGMFSQSYYAMGNKAFGGSLGKSAPFRRRILEDERMKDEVPFSGSPGTLGDDEGEDGDENPSSKNSSPKPDDLDAIARRMNISVDKSAVTSGLNSKSSIQFPGMSPERDRPVPLALSPSNFGANGTPRRMSISNLLSRSRVNSYGDSLDGGGMIQAPFLRSRVQSRMSQSDAFESAARVRRESTYAQELNVLSMFHLRIMLRQMLTTAARSHPVAIPNLDEWEETLFNLALQVSRDLTFLSSQPKEGVDMDVRRYVKIKKIPGGKPGDSEYVDGAVITKNVAHKKMTRLQKNARVMHITFPLDFQRVEGKYIPFGQILTQEQQYIDNLTSRIAHFRPHLVLVEKSVSRLALDSLVKHGIAVARTVKPSAVSFVSRMTGGDLVSSIDKLMLEPRLGHCARFRIQTFDHQLIPGQRKTYMRFEGCGRNVGCTIVLRGGSVDLLRRIKNVTRFLIFVVRNLKMETCLWKDAVVTLPLLTADAVPIPGPLKPKRLSFGSPALHTPHLSVSGSEKELYTLKVASYNTESAIVDDGEEGNSSDLDKDLPAEDRERIKLSRRIQESIEPYERTFISVSATLRFQPPHPIRQMKEIDILLKEKRKAWEDKEVMKHERRITISSATTTPTTTSIPDKDAATTTVTPGTSTTLTTPAQTPLVNEPSPEADDYFGLKASSTLAPAVDQTEGTDLTPVPAGTLQPSDAQVINTFGNLTSFRDSIVSLTVPSPATESIPAPVILRQPSDIIEESELALVQLRHDEQKRVWEWYLRKNADDFNVDKYQNIFVRECIAPVIDGVVGRACFIPKLLHIHFYGESDMMLGQYIDKNVTEAKAQLRDPKAICPGKSCGRPMLGHVHKYLHNESCLSIAVQEASLPKTGYMPPYPEVMVTWSVCRICSCISPCLPASEEMQKYSFAKFLELYFYPADVTLIPELNCAHNIYQNHVRYISFKGFTVSIMADPIKLYDVTFPPMYVRVRPENLLQLKNNDYERLHVKNVMWYSSLIDDLRLISIDASTGDEDADARLLHDVNLLILRAEQERCEIENMINKAYRDTSPTDTLALNSVRRHRQDRIVGWQQDFDRLPKPRQLALPEKDKRSMTFGSVRNMFPKRSELVGLFDQSVASRDSDAESVLFQRRIVSDSATSASESEQLENLRNKIMSQEAKKTLKEIVSLGSQEQVVGSLGKEIVALPPVVEVSRSEPEGEADSDVTIEASIVLTSVEERAKPAEDSQEQVQSKSPDDHIPEPSGPGEPPGKSTPSRLPRLVDNQLTVAELIQRYQIPENTSDIEMPANDSEADSELLPSKIRRTPRSKLHKRRAAEFNEACQTVRSPRQVSRTLQRNAASRIPGPTPTDSRGSSRQVSPEKRSFTVNLNTGKSMNLPKPGTATPTRSKGKLTLRTAPRDKSANPMRSTPGLRRPSSKRNPSVSQPGKVNTLTRQFEKMSRDNDRLNRRYSVIRGRRARPVASAKARAVVFDNVRDAILDESGNSDVDEADDEEERGGDVATGTKESERSQSQDSSKQITPTSTSEDPASTITGDSVVETPESSVSCTPPVLESQPETPITNVPQVNPPTSFSDNNLPTSIPNHTTLVNAFNKLWPQQSISPHLLAEVEGEDPLADPEHIFRESDIVVRTDEPTSIIALTLDSPKYKEDLAKSKSERKLPRVEATETFMPDDGTLTDSNSNWGVVNVDRVEDGTVDHQNRVSFRAPSQYSFESSGITITCTVLFAEQFDSLRQCFGCEESMIESLARCVKWDNRGGKSGSGFLKTKDDKFLAKELSKAELNAMETFAPAYFDYVSTAVATGRPTLLAKIFGCYKITFKNNETSHKSRGKVCRMNLLVMENLFCDRRFTKKYDLKGSTRNRHVQATGGDNEVLLDDNLVEVAHISPFYLREHTKRIFRGALWNDSKFLSELNVMDYSLVVGVDEQNNELVVGIVDYIRTYTWDKRLETWVKESAFLAGPGKGEPTVVTPKQYKARFRSAMERYFPLIPDRWTKQRDAPDEEGNSLLDLWPDW